MAGGDVSDVGLVRCAQSGESWTFDRLIVRFRPPGSSARAAVYPQPSGCRGSYPRNVHAGLSNAAEVSLRKRILYLALSYCEQWLQELATRTRA
jgi:hypothetical protein